MSHVHLGERGQVGVIILLIMAALLTIGLSLATRTTDEIFVTEQRTQSTRVFNAAEAGIEQALSSDLTAITSGSFTSGDGMEVTYSVSQVRQLETLLFEGVSVSVDVTGATDGQELRVDWSQSDSCTNDDPASLVVSIYYDDTGTTRVRHLGLGACDRSDGFTTAQTINDNGLRRRYDVALQTGDFLVRIRPVYNNTQVRVSGNGFDLPVQYFAIRSQATNPDGNEVRTVEVNRTLSAAPSIMDYALYSGTTIIK